MKIAQDIEAERRFCEHHANENKRSGEGSMVALRDGRVLFVYSHFAGDNDFHPAALVARWTSDAGRSWSEPVDFLRLDEGATNLMSVSLLRLADDSLAECHIRKLGKDRSEIHFRKSFDEGDSWSESRVLPVDGYLTINNDRLIQLPDGRLLAPLGRAAYPRAPYPLSHHCACGCFYSDDNGQTWQPPHDWLEYEREDFVPSSTGVEEGVDSSFFLRHHLNFFQEPGVVALPDGRVMMWMRSEGHIYHAWSEDSALTWTRPVPMDDFSVNLGPQSLRWIRSLNGILMVYNDKSPVRYGSPSYYKRTPLSLAFSEDGKNWVKLDALEGSESRNYCYCSILETQDALLFSYYQSETRQDESGTSREWNLASLKTARISLEALKANIFSGRGR